MEASTQSIGSRPAWLPDEEYPFESRFAQIGPNTVHYIDEGSGPVLLFVHAGPAWSFVFRDLILALRDRFRCVALDFPGTGLSSHDAVPALESCSETLELFVKHLDLRDITIVAHDVGCPVSIAAEGIRHRVRRIAVTEGFAWPLAEENPKVARMLRFVGGGLFGSINQATNILAGMTSTKAGVGGSLSRIGRRAFRGPYRDRRVRRNATRLLGEAARADGYLIRVRDSVRDDLAHMPVFLALGGKSPVIKEGFLERWRELSPTAEVHIIDGAHHFPMCDAPDEIADLIAEWVGRTSTS